MNIKQYLVIALLSGNVSSVAQYQAAGEEIDISKVINKSIKHIIKTYKLTQDPYDASRYYAYHVVYTKDWLFQTSHISAFNLYVFKVEAGQIVDAYIITQAYNTETFSNIQVSFDDSAAEHPTFWSKLYHTFF